jgi:anti-anti-sigma factor
MDIERVRSTTKREPVGHRAVVWLRGHHDRSTVAAVSEKLARAISFNNLDVIVDLRGVEFMDSTTVGVLTRAEEFLRFRTRSLRLRSPSRFARLVLDPFGLRDFLESGPLARFAGDVEL